MADIGIKVVASFDGETQRKHQLIGWQLIELLWSNESLRAGVAEDVASRHALLWPRKSLVVVWMLKVQMEYGRKSRFFERH